MADKTLREHMQDVGFDESEIAEHLDRLSKEIIGLTLMRTFELLPQADREALSELPEEELVKEVMVRAPQYLSQEECREIEGEERQKRVDAFYKEMIAPRLEGETDA